MIGFLVESELSESDAVNRAAERKCGGDEMGTDDHAAMLFLCSPAQGLLSSSQKGKTTLLCFLDNLPVESLPRQRQICDQGYIRWIFKQNLEDIFADSLVLSWLFCRDCPSVHFLVTIYCSSATVQQLTLWCVIDGACFPISFSVCQCLNFILPFCISQGLPFSL
ncbi:unnamed protein product [Triticum turgidum subsp. durum]|uniref:Uncharacterized protein n=1 Tax=Triticum turgidum subsp. durum TaxID=4567 RepID=A0A9R0SWG4_TRITD|nr:unnamed protein product [Triticum turgidum subsp. durum]